MIPSGYKEDVVYSPIPTDGSGDLSFTRASNGTRVNSAGLVEVCPWNLVLDSETFNTGNWIQYQAGISANTTTAPNGTSTADSLVDNTANDIHINFQLLTLNAGVNTISVYAKASTLSNIVLYSYDNVSQFYFSNKFDLANGTTTGANQSIENVGNGWYRCSFTFTTVVSGTHYVYVALNNGTSNSFAGTGSGAVFIWGYQANIGSTAKPYFPTTDRLNVPRLTYQNGGGGCPSLLLEKQSTNFIVASQEFNNSTYWVIANSVVSANATTSPDGTQNADLWYPSTNGDVSSRRLLQVCTVSTSGVNITATVYVKRNNKRWLFFAGPDATSANHNCWFDIQNGVVGTKGSAVVSATIESAGNGWYRCSVTSLATSTTQYVFLSATDADADGTVTANGTDGMYFYGAQLEASSYPTSYIPTTSASATRVADACSKTGISSLIGQTEGTVFADFYLTDGYDNNQAVVTLSDNSSNNFILIQRYLGSLGCRIDASGSIQVDSYPASTSGGRHKIALAYASNDVKVYLDGTAIITDTSVSVPAMSKLNIGSFYDQTLQLGSGVNEVVVFPTRLTNAELASLTTI
jgi:hypothetical protein